MWLGSATTLNTQGLTRSVIRLITPPLAASDRYDAFGGQGAAKPDDQVAGSRTGEGLYVDARALGPASGRLGAPVLTRL